MRGRRQDFHNAFEDVTHVGFTDSRVGASGARISEKIVEKFVHAVDPIAHEPKYLPRLIRKAVAQILLEPFGGTVDSGERCLQIVGCNIGEILQDRDWTSTNADYWSGVRVPLHP
jgi:hypothetical protein